jgi:hypothetical protein
MKSFQEKSELFWGLYKKKIDGKIRLFARYLFVFFEQATK